MKPTLGMVGRKISRPFSLLDAHKRLEAALTKKKLTTDTLLYHGTSADFDTFKISPRKTSTPVDEVNAFFFTPDVKTAYSHALRSAKQDGGKARVVSVNLEFKNMADVTNRVKRYQREIGNFGQAKRKAFAEIDPAKFDGIEFRGDSVNTPEYVVFKPNAIKVVNDGRKKQLEANNKPTILKNPSASRIKALIKNAQYNELKGLISGKDVYVWNNVADWHHHMQYEKIGKGYDPTDPFMKNPTWNNDGITFFVVPEDKDKIAIGNKNGLEGVDYILANHYLAKLIKENDWYVDNPNRKKIKDSPDFIKAVDYLKEHNLTAKTSDVYGWWLDQTGKLIEVPFEGHQLIARGYIKKFYLSDYLRAKQAASDRDEYYEERDYALQELGWIKLQNGDKDLNIQVGLNAVNLQTFNAFKKFIDDSYYSEYFIDISTPDGQSYPKGVKPSYRDISNPNRVVSIIGSCIGKVEMVANEDKLIEKIVKSSENFKPSTHMEASNAYGYWILPDGKMEKVDFEMHVDLVHRHYGKDNKGSYYRAFQDGWIRLVEEPTILNVELKYNTISLAALKTLTNYVLKEANHDGFVLDILVSNSTVLPKAIKRNSVLNSGKALISVVSKCLNKNLTASHDAYGYWITSDGQMLEVQYQAHDSFAEKYIVKYLYNEYFNYVMKTDNGDYTTFCLNQGWIRIVNRNNELSIQAMENSITPAAFTALNKDIRSEYFEKLVLDLTSEDRSKHKGGSFDTESNAKMREFNTLMRANLRKNTIQSDFNDEQYGYWFTDKGELLDVEEMQHDRVAKNYIDNHVALLNKYEEENEYPDHKTFALKTLGWIRGTVTGDLLYIEIDKNDVSDKAYKRLSNFMNKESTFQEYYFDVSGKYKYTDKKVALLNMVKEHVKKNTIKASLEYPYGYWITPDGELIEAENEGGHPTAFRKYDELHPTDLTKDEKRDVIAFNINWLLLKRGWIRLVKSYIDGQYHVNIGRDSVNPKALSKLTAFLPRVQDRIMVEVTTNENSDGNSYSVRTKADLIKLVKNNLKINKIEASTSEPYFSNKALKEIHDEADNPMSRTTLIMMKPSDFLKMAEPAFSQDKYDKAQQLNKERIQYNSVPYLIFENNGDKTATVTGHEGRHRSMVLKELGDRLMPVAFRSSGGTVGSIRWGSQKGYDKIDIWPETLIGEGANKKNRIPFPDSEYYPRKKTIEASDKYDSGAWWVTDNGSIVDVGEENEHYKALPNSLPDQKAEIGFPAVIKALKQGYIRIRKHSNVVYVNVYQNTVNDNSMRGLNKLFNNIVADTIELEVFKEGDEFNDNIERFAFSTLGINKLMRRLRDNRRKTIVAIDENNTIQWIAEEKLIETWLTGNSQERIDLINHNEDYVVREFAPDGTLVTQSVYKFLETARDYLMQVVRDKQKHNIFYSKESDMKKMQAADTEKVFERWETPDSKHAIVFGLEDKTFVIKNYVRNQLTQNWHSSGEYSLGRMSQEEAYKEFMNSIKNLSSMNFKKVDTTKHFTTPVDQKKNEIAQVTVRGRAGAEKLSDGYQRFTVQPNIKGLELVYSKKGKNTYAKILHKASGLAVLNLTDKPLSFSLTELIERINNSDLNRYNWSLSQADLFNKYGGSTLSQETVKFNKSLAEKMQDKTDKALEDGLKGWVRDFLIARYMARPAAAKNIKRNIDSTIEKQGLDSEKVYNYYGDLHNSKERDTIIRNLGLVRVGTSAPYKYEFAKAPVKVEEIEKIKPPTREEKLDSKIKQQRAQRESAQDGVVDKPARTGLSDSMIGDYVEGLDKGGIKRQGVVLTQNYNKKTGQSSGKVVILKTKDDPRSGSTHELTKLKRLLIKPPKALATAYNIVAAKRRLEAAAPEDIKNQMRELNRKETNPGVHHRLKFKTGDYVTGQYIGFRDARVTVKGILIRENTAKNNRIASGGILVMKRGEDNFEVRAATHIERCLERVPKKLQDQFNKIKHRLPK